MENSNNRREILTKIEGKFLAFYFQDTNELFYDISTSEKGWRWQLRDKKWITEEMFDFIDNETKGAKG